MTVSIPMTGAAVGQRGRCWSGRHASQKETISLGEAEQLTDLRFRVVKQ